MSDKYIVREHGKQGYKEVSNWPEKQHKIVSPQATNHAAELAKALDDLYEWADNCGAQAGLNAVMIKADKALTNYKESLK